MPDSSKKRKQFTSEPAQTPAKKTKKSDRHSSHPSHDKQFNTVHASLVVSIPPIFARNPRSGVQEMLDSMVMRYIPAFQGVVLSHSNMQFSGKTASIKADCPFLVANVLFDAIVWRPHTGMKLVGKVNLFSPDHVSLLVHRTFNVSIPRNHIPDDQWVFEYGPADNDPEYGAIVQEQDEEKQGKDSIGKWVQKVTGEKMGGDDGFLEFTVIGLTVANEMLSLLGSIQPNPFSQKHVVNIPASLPGRDSSATDNGVYHASDRDPFGEDEIDVDEEDEDDGDTFRELGRRVDAAIAQETQKTPTGAQAGEKRRKRKDDEGKEKERKRKKS